MSDELSMVKGLTIPNQSDLLVVSTMWADCVGDSSSTIVGMFNCRELERNIVDQDDNMSATSHLMERMTEGEAVVLVYGQNGENDGTWLLYRF